jgi:hypothetical protein
MEMNATKPGSRFRHVRTGQIYTVDGTATLKSALSHDLDDEIVVLYRDEVGRRFARVLDEFEDGRFAPVADEPQLETDDAGQTR